MRASNASSTTLPEIYLLLEHQSTEDALMPFRVLGYQVRIWVAWLKQHQGARELPPIVAVVLAQVDGRWEAPTQLGDIIDFGSDAERAALGPFVPRFSFRLDDLARLTDTKLAKRTMPAVAKLALAALRSLRSVRLTDASVKRRLRRWVRDVPATKAGIDALRSLVQYVWWVRPHLADDWMKSLVAEAPGGAEDMVMTTARQFFEQGEARGEARGQVAAAQMLLKLLTVRFHAVPVDARARVLAADVATLQRWSDAAMTADSLDAALAG